MLLGLTEENVVGLVLTNKPVKREGVVGIPVTLILNTAMSRINKVSTEVMFLCLNHVSLLVLLFTGVM